MDIESINWEQWSYITTTIASVIAILGIPVGLVSMLIDQRNERLAEQWEIDDKLNEEYNQIIDQFIDKPELDKHEKTLDNEEYARQQYRIYEKIIALYERAFMRLYDRKEKEIKAMWHIWEDYIGEWLQQPNFKNQLEKLLKGEDPEFAEYMRAQLKKLEKADAVVTYEI